MAIAAGDYLDTTFTVVDTMGNPVTGLSPSVLVSVDPDDHDFPFTFTELGAGSYKATSVNPAIIEGYYYLLIAANDPLDQKFNVSWRVGHQYVGERISGFITVLDGNGNGVTGLLLSTIVSTDPNGEPFSFSYTELGTGAYRATSDERANVAGTYFLQVAANDPNDQRYELNWDVDPHPQQRQPDDAIRYPSAGGLTLQELRRQVARELGDYYEFRATDFSSTDTVRDDVTFAQSVHHFRGMELTFTDGSVQNIGLSRTVQGLDPESHTLTFSPPVNVNIRPGDSGELHNVRGKGWTFAEKNAAINAAIARAGEQHASIPAIWEVPEPFNRANPIIPIPESFTYLCGVKWRDRRGIERDVPFTMWKVDVTYPHVMIHRLFVNTLNGHTVILIGRERPHQLEHDWERTSIPAEWIVQEAKAILQEADVSPSVENTNRSRLLAMSRQASDVRRTLVLNRMPPNSVRIR